MAVLDHLLEILPLQHWYLFAKYKTHTIYKGFHVDIRPRWADNIRIGLQEITMYTRNWVDSA